MDDKALRAWEDSRDMTADLEQSIHEMLAGQGKPVSMSMPSPVDWAISTKGALKDAL